MKKFLLIAAALVLASCSDSDDSALIRIVHLSPDAPAVDVLVDGGRVLAGVSYPSASDYLEVSAGARELKVNAADTSTSVITANVTLNEEESYTVVAANRLSSIEPLVLVDERGGTPGDEASVRVLHGAPSAPAVDVYVTALGADLNTATPVLKNVSFKASSGYLTVPAGTYQVRVTVAGTKTVAIDSGSLTLKKQDRFTAIARDNVGGGAPFALLLLDDR
jgi:hypothetical protein